MKTPAIRLIGAFGLLLVALFPLGTASGQGLDVDDRDLEAWSSERLAASFVAISRDLLSRPELLAPQIELAFGLVKVATELDPESSSVWRRLLEISTALEGELPGTTESRRQAIEALVKLDPDDPVMRLRLLLDRIEGRATAQQRVAAYELLLSPENLDRLGRRAGARIAYDLALLQQRIGDMDSSAASLAEAVALDPSFPQAADMAAGFFRAVVPTPIDEAELLAIAFTASPGDVVVARSLANLVLAAGSYEEADELIQLTSLLYRPSSPVQNALIADRMLAMWGAGRIEEARTLAERARRAHAAVIRNRMIQKGADPTETRSIEIPPASSVAIVAAVIEARNGDRMQRDAAVSTLFESYEFELSELDRAAAAVQDAPDLTEDDRSQRTTAINAQRAALYADQAWARAWFGWSPGSGDSPDEEQESTARLSLDDLLKGAVQGGALDPDQQLVIRGWEAMEKQDFVEARRLLAPTSESSPYAEAGVAMLDEVEGATKDAARRYLKVYEARPGTLLGLWCRSRLEAILEVKVPQPEQADLMAEMLRETLPDSVGRVLRDPKHGVIALTAEPTSIRTAAFEPLEIKVTLTNVSELDLAIGADAPISSTIALVVDVADVVGIPSGPIINRQARPSIISIDRRFTLESQDSIEIEVDLWELPLAFDLTMASIYGGAFKIRAVANHVVTPSMNIDAGRFGRETLTPVFRIDGIDPLLGEKLMSMVEQMKSGRTVSDAKIIAMMLQLVMQRPNGSVSLSEDSLRFATIDACLALPPLARAWAMSLLIPGSAGTIRLADRLVVDGSRASMALALSRFSGSPTSNAIVAGLKSPDPLIKRLAEASRDLAELSEVQMDAEILEFDASEQEPAE